MKRCAFLVAGIAFITSLLVAVSGGTALADPTDGDPSDGGQQGIGWQYSESANGYYRPPQDEGSPDGGGGPTGPPTVFTDWGDPGKWVNCPDSDPAFACEGEPGQAEITGILCPDTGPRGLPNYPWIRYEREIQGGEPTLWVGVEADCSEPDDDNFIPVEEFSWTIDCQLFQPLGDPAIAMSPPNARTFVNWPTIVSTDYPSSLDGYEVGGDCANDIDQPAIVESTQTSTTLRIPIHINRPGGGLDGEILAEASYNWDFGDGDGSANRKGRPYEEGRYPEDNPGYYVTHAYSEADDYVITLTVTWTGTVTVEPPPGTPAQPPEEIEAVSPDNTLEIDVDEAQSVITR